MVRFVTEREKLSLIRVSGLILSACDEMCRPILAYDDDEAVTYRRDTDPVVLNPNGGERRAADWWPVRSEARHYASVDVECACIGRLQDAVDAGRLQRVA